MLYYYTHEFILHSQAIPLTRFTACYYGAYFIPIKIFSSVIGSSLILTPTALYTAFAIAGDGVLITISPMDFCTKGASWLIAAFKFYLNFSHILTAWYFVLHEGVFMDPSLVGIGYILLHLPCQFPVPDRLLSVLWPDFHLMVFHSLLLRQTGSVRYDRFPLSISTSAAPAINGGGETGEVWDSVA